MAAAIPAYGAITAPSAHVAVTSAAANGVAGQYIVTVKHTTGLSRMIGFPTLHRYENGFAAHLTSQQLKKLQSNPDVVAIEQDQIVKIDTTQKNPANWGLDRIAEPVLPLSHSYQYTHTGSDVDAYVIDTGIETTLSQFGGRANTVYGGKDCNGHGTHVAGIIGSKTYGVAKQVRLHGVRVLDCDGQGSTSDVIAGIDWVRKHHAARSVANLSLGGTKSTALNTAVYKLAKSGVFVSVAAGNDGASACGTSPASAIGVEAVAASDSTDGRAWFSNYGKCVDVYAPGVDIKSTYKGGTATLSGTSMATPFVTGTAALYKSAHGQSSFVTIRDWIKSYATKNAIKDNEPGTPNLLLFKSTL